MSLCEGITYCCVAFFFFVCVFVFVCCVVYIFFVCVFCVFHIFVLLRRVCFPMACLRVCSVTFVLCVMWSCPFLVIQLFFYLTFIYLFPSSALFPNISKFSTISNMELEMRTGIHFSGYVFLCIFTLLT